MLNSIRIRCSGWKPKLFMDRLKKHEVSWLINASFCTETNKDARSATVPNINIVQEYNKDERDLILNALNNFTSDKLKRYDISKGRIKNVEIYRRKNGSFETLEDVLFLEGFGVEVLQKLCKSILKGDNEDVKVEPKELVGKARRNKVTPQLDNEQRSVINTVTGIYVGVNTVSWAKLNRDGSLELWDCEDCRGWPLKVDITMFLDLVNSIRQYHLANPSIYSNHLISEALSVRRRLPESDVYVMESISQIGQDAHISKVVTNLQHAQLTAMLYTLLATKVDSTKEEQSDTSENSEIINNCYFLRAQAAARHFRIMIGSERVSGQTTVEKIMDGGMKEFNHIIPLSISQSLRNDYERRDNFGREILSQALFLSAAFVDLAVR